MLDGGTGSAAEPRRAEGRHASLRFSSQMEFTPTTIMFATHDLLKVPVDVSKEWGGFSKAVSEEKQYQPLASLPLKFSFKKQKPKANLRGFFFHFDGKCNELFIIGWREVYRLG